MSSTQLAYPNTDYLRNLAFRGGHIMLENFGFGMPRELKKDRTRVTKSDKDINKLVQSALLHDFPDVSFSGEEGSRLLDDAEFRVDCDPVDGTFPFSCGIPISTFCIGVRRGNIPLVGLIYDPFMKRMWHAEKGNGCFLDVMARDFVPGSKFDGEFEREQVKVSKHSTLKDASISMMWWKDSLFNVHGACSQIVQAGATFMNPVSIAYIGGLIASGEFDASVFPSTKSLETSAMHVIAEEAGGKITDIHGNPMLYNNEGTMEGHIVSNGTAIHDELVRIMNRCQ